MWTYRGQKRPPFARVPQSGQESVWDYPRPPKLSVDKRLIEVYNGETLLAASNATYRVLETASPPSFYIPPEDVNWDFLFSTPGRSMCEWKGMSIYWSLASHPKVGRVAWSYPAPTPAFEAIKDYVSFYPSILTCFVAGERAHGQPGGYYGGWVTSQIVGPFKGDPETRHW